MTRRVPDCADDPAADYMVVRQELALYNAEYCARPHVVALNKMDLEDASELRDEVSNDIMAAAKTMQVCLLCLHSALTRQTPASLVTQDGPGG